MIRYCREPECTMPPHARGYCVSHYSKARREGWPNEARCRIPGCDALTHRSLDICKDHCKTESRCLQCDKQVYARALCRTHYQSDRKARNWLKRIEELREELET